MSEAGTPLRLVDRLALHVTRLTGLGLVATAVWSMYSDLGTHLIWDGVMLLTGIALAALYLPILRIAAFVFLFFAGLVVLGGLSPFAALDMSETARARSGMELRQIAVVLALSALFVLLAFCIERARRIRRGEAQLRRSDRAPPQSGAPLAPGSPRTRAAPP